MDHTWVAPFLPANSESFFLWLDVVEKRRRRCACAQWHNVDVCHIPPTRHLKLHSRHSHHFLWIFFLEEDTSWES